MKQTSRFMALCTVAMVALAVGSAQGYAVIEVADGGTIMGVVTLTGAPPAPKAYNLVTFPDPEYCGRISDGKGYRLLRDFTVQKAGGISMLKDVVVFLEGVDAGKPFDVSVPRVEARDCQFTPFVTVVRDGHAVEVVNMDPVMHDVQAYETSHERGTRVLFNSPLPMNQHHNRGDIHATHHHTPGRSMVEPVRLSKGRRIFVMQCGFHAYMESWAVAVSNPYYQVTDASGAYAIDNIPPGTYRLVVWHPQTGPMHEQVVTVKPRDALTMNFMLRAPGDRRTAYRIMEPRRFGPESLGRPIAIEPLVERQQ
jgi:hypothetical protein